MQQIQNIVKLSPAERAVLNELLEHDTVAQVADALFVSQHTVKSHIYHLCGKFNVNSRHRLVARAYQWGYLAVDGDDNAKQ